MFTKLEKELRGSSREKIFEYCLDGFFPPVFGAFLIYLGINIFHQGLMQNFIDGIIGTVAAGVVPKVDRLVSRIRTRV